MQTSQEYKFNIKTADIVKRIRQIRENGDIDMLIVYNDGIWKLSITVQLGGWLQYLVRYQYKNGKSGMAPVEVIWDKPYVRAKEFKLPKVLENKIIQIHKELNNIKY